MDGSANTVMSLMITGGPVMWPLLILLGIACVIALDWLLWFIRYRQGKDLPMSVSDYLGLAILDFITTSAPIIGFLGTVTGMISAFASVSESTSVQLPVVAGGLYEALLTTAFGLIVSLVSSLMSFLVEYGIERTCADIEEP
jgi:biopolymer transport protein ExbB/TolQ